MQQKQTPYTRYQVQHHIGIVEFFTAQHNSMPAAILADLAKTINTAANDPNSKVLILKTGGEKSFCAGASFDELLLIQNEEEGRAFFSGFANVINAMRKCPKFILGRVQGKAIGGGVGLAASCDYTFATTEASIKLSELAVGIGPFVVSPAIERKIGTSATYELAIDACNFRTAAWAKEKGLYAEVFNTIEEMDKAVLELAITLAASSTEAMIEIKKTFWTGTEHWDQLLPARAAISGRLIVNEDAKSYLASFKKWK
ncbi:MAG: enoyl-CoA hydratase/isomerase family protein [Chitinophagaceae bacterium]|nr:enoyl-CoA hydratase/isomerase family protein [Chitinophagaceae bacterium]